MAVWNGKKMLRQTASECCCATTLDEEGWDPRVNEQQLVRHPRRMRANQVDIGLEQNVSLHLRVPTAGRQAGPTVRLAVAGAGPRAARQGTMASRNRQ